MSNQNQGPDRILEADNLTTTDRYGCVKLRIIEDDSFKYDAVSIPTYFERWANKGPKKTALAVKREGEWVKWTYEEYRRDVLFAAKAFIHLGLDPFSSVAIFGFNAPEWFIAALGAIHAQGLCTGLYPTNSRETNGFILHDAKARVLVVEDAAAVEKVWPLLDEVDSLRTIVQYLGEPSRPGVIGWKQLMDIGKAEGDMELKRRLSNMAINNAATLIYTSGTTGNPKGVMLSHDNILFTAESALECCNWRKHKVVVVSYLPLSHIAAMLTDIYGVMGSCGTTYFADKNALKGTLVDTLKEVRPTHFFGVPRVWEKIMEGMLDKGKSVTGLKRKIADKCKQAGLQHHLQGKSGIKYKISEALLFKKVREALGLDRTVGFYSAAAPLGMETMRYFLSLDIVLMELYGMSETTGPHCITNDEYQRIGSVGKVMPGVRARLSEPNSDGEGEMCMWGRNVMMGYLNREDKTSEDVDLEGWMHSGDLATEDKNGYYYITGEQNVWLECSSIVDFLRGMSRCHFFNRPHQRALDYCRWRERGTRTSGGAYQARIAHRVQRGAHRRQAKIPHSFPHTQNRHRSRDGRAHIRAHALRHRLVPLSWAQEQ